MRPSRLVRTSSFRLTILYAGLFVVSVSILFGVVFLAANHTMAQQIDHIVLDEMDEVEASVSSLSLDQLQPVIAEFSRRSPRLYYLLQNDKGAFLAGNLRPQVPQIGLVHVPLHQSTTNVVAVRGRGVAVSGGYLFIGASDHEVREMREAMLRGFLLSLLVIAALALSGGVVMSLGVLRRVEVMGRATRDIVDGDLTRRIPVRGSDDEFDQLAIGVNAMLDRIQSLMIGLQQVSSDIAHDMRTPLTRMRQRLELTRQRENTVEQLHSSIGRSIDDVDAILSTFGALLRIAQVESGSRRAGFGTVDLASLLIGLEETYVAVAEERSQSLTVTTGPCLMVQGDQDLLVQMFANLIENAIRHSGERAIIIVQADYYHERLRVTVGDTGPGIPQHLRKRVMNRFYRLESSRSTEGDGLGLSMVAAIAHLHGAELKMADNLPGLRVMVQFPK